ncbi:MAG: hypothetical protein PVH73_01620 [Candidatus Bathyarchaeota archaeon]|jgi:hypothetical protein
MPSRLKRALKELAINIIADFVAAVILYLILEEYISEPLSQIFPFLPTLLVVSLVLATIGGLFYRLYHSVKFHRFVEKTANNIHSFTSQWMRLNEAFREAVNSYGQPNYNKRVQEFEEVRLRLVYEYPRINSLLRGRFGFIDNIRGVIVRDYDVIANLLMVCPFNNLDPMNRRFIVRDFNQSWDTGRTALVNTLGAFNETRVEFIHQVYWRLRLVPRSSSLDSQNNQNEN